MKEQQNSERWIFVVAFALLSVIFNDMPFFGGMNRFLVSGMVGATGGITGAILYALVAKRNNYIKYGTLMLGICVVLGVFYLVNSYYKGKEREEKKNPLDILMNSWNSRMEEAVMHPQPIDTVQINALSLSKEERSHLVTCEICGYIAVNPDSVSCYNCFGSTFGLSDYSLIDKNKWLKDQQLIEFYPDEKTHKVNFFEPTIENGFKKDPSWKPVISEQDVIEYRKKYPY